MARGTRLFIQAMLASLLLGRICGHGIETVTAARHAHLLETAPNYSVL